MMMQTVGGQTTFVTALAMLATQLMSQRFKLNNMFFFSLQTVMLTLFQTAIDPVALSKAGGLWAFATTYVQGYGWVFALGLASVLVPYVWKRFRQPRAPPPKRYTSKINLYRMRHIKRFYRYMARNRDVFPMETKELHCGVPELLDTDKGLSEQTSSIRHKKWFDDENGMDFCDPNFNIEGTLFFKRRTCQVDDPTKKKNEGQGDEATQERKTFYLVVAMREGDMSALAYLKQIKVWLENYKSYTHLHYYKVMRNSSYKIAVHEVSFYKGATLSVAERQTQFFDSFFHNKKRMLLRRARVMLPEKRDVFVRFGQVPMLNLLLHGPPGTGKSTFAYRLASLLNRHVQSIDLRSIDDKRTLYSYIQGTTNYGSHVSYQKAITVFEEFDIAVKYLYDKGKYRDEVVQGGAHQWSFETYKETKTGEPTKSEGAMRSSFVHDEFHLKDLLELLQGPVPMDGQIIIATTNHYEEIKQLCPALFRPGRLTPVYFGHFNRNTLNEFVQYYFGSDHGIPETFKLGKADTLPLSPAKLIEMALYAHEVHGGDKALAFAGFMTMLRDAMRTKTKI